MKKSLCCAPRWTYFVLASFAALFFMRMSVKTDPDVFFHLKEGGRVLREFRMPVIEDYSYTRPGVRLIATEWLSGAIFAVLFYLGGPILLNAFNTALLIGSLFFLGRSWEGEDVPDELEALLLALAGFAFLNFALAKVQNFTFFFFALFLWGVRSWEGGKRHVSWVMAAALAVWVNLHGGFMLGWVLLQGICLFDFLRTRRLVSFAPGAAGTFACFLHPDGVMAFVYPIWFFFAAPVGRRLIIEWRPLEWAPSAFPYALILVAAVAASVDRLRAKFPWTAMAAVFLVLGLRTRKMLPFYALSACAAAGLASARANLTRVQARLCLVGAALVLFTVGVVEVNEAVAASAFGAMADFEREYPREAAERLVALYPGRRLFHPYDWGGYLTYKLPPGEKVFIDGRLEPYWTLLGDYDLMIHARPGWQNLFDAYRIETALLPPLSAAAEALKADPNWKAVGSDGRATLFIRRSIPIAVRGKIPP